MFRTTLEMRAEGCQRRSSLTLPTLTAFVFLSRYHFDHIVRSNDLTENITYDICAGGLLVEDLGICDLDKIFLKKKTIGSGAFTQDI